MKTLKLRAYAKLNLFLDITGKRPDGYHEIKTVMQSIGLYDELEFIIGNGTGIEIYSNRSDLPNGNDNLVYKGIMAVLDYAYFSPGCKITVNLKKNIPSGAGMGGGSADCAAAIIAMNELFHVGLDEDEMRTAAAMCGADVPFCISGGAALCEGIGEKITRLKSLENASFAVVKPNEAISTPAAYKLFDERGKFGAGNYGAFEQAFSSGSAQAVGGALYNAFTECCGLKKIGGIKSSLLNGGAFGAEMTGSGSAVFGIFGDMSKAKAVSESCDESFCGAYPSVSRGVEIV